MPIIAAFHRLTSPLALATALAPALMGALIGGAPAWAAQMPPPGTNAVETSTQVDRDRSDRVAPSLPRAPAVPVTPPPSAVVQLPPAAQVVASFAGVRVPGSSLPAATFQAAVHSYIGKPLVQDVVQGIADAVAAAYAASDIAYYAVSIPAQTPEGGILTVQVVEGRLTEYHLDHPSRSTPTRLIAAHMRRLINKGVLRKSALRRQMALLQEIPGQTVAANIRQLNTKGDLSLELTITRRQLQMDLTLDNSGIANVINSVQAQVGITVNGLLREGDSTRVAAFLPFEPSRYTFVTASHSTPIGASGLMLSGSYTHLHTRTIGSDIAGDAGLAGISLSYPVIRGMKTNLTLSASLDGVNSDNYYLDAKFGSYRARAVRLAASWSHGDEKKGYAVSAVVSQGLNGLGAMAFEGYSTKDFSKANLQAVAVRKFGKRWTATLNIKGQYSDSLLPVTERFSLGGRGAGLAYRIGDITADRAVAGSMELAWQLPPKSILTSNISLFVYADGAVGRSIARPTYNIPTYDYALASAGGGVRVGLGRHWRASVEVAVPTKRPDPSYGKAARVLFGISRVL